MHGIVLSFAAYLLEFPDLAITFLPDFAQTSGHIPLFVICGLDY